MNVFYTTICVSLAVIFLLKSPVEGRSSVNKAEQDLMMELFPQGGSIKDVLPVESDMSPVNVTFEISLRQLVDIDERSQIITLSIWIRQYWNNAMLTWNKTAFGNISSVNVDRNLVWVPDMCLYNTADDSGSLYQQLDTKIIVQHNGDCSWLAPIILKSECKIDVKYFPFDEQSCRLQFGSWTYNGRRIDIMTTKPGADTSIYITNGEWDLVEAPVVKHVEFYPCCPEPYPSLIYVVRIRRRILYYVSNLIVPCGVIAALAFLSFCLPAESGERVSLVITVLLAMTVYMLMVSSAMPPTSEVIPLIGKFYLAVMVEIAFCLVATCVTIKWHHTITPMTPLVHSIVVRFLWRYLCGTGENGTDNKSPQVTSDATSYCLQNNNAQSQAQLGDYDSAAAPCNMTHIQLKEIRNNPFSELESINKDVSVLSTKVEMEQSDEEIRRDWKKAGEVLDRIFFIIFALVFFLFSAILFSSIPGYYN